ncbi:MAG: TMEM175 family protein [Actinomycetes bacterium]
MEADKPTTPSDERSLSDTTRLEALSDGVIAVAITLLVLGLVVPHVGEESLWKALVAQWPAYAAYVTSFLVIGILWINHHSLFRQIRYVTRGLMLINLVLLMFIVAIPFATSLVADYLTEPGFNAKVAMAIYNAIALMIAIAIASLWGYVLRRPELLDPDVDVSAARKSFPRFGIGMVVYAVLILVSFISAVLALAVTFMVAVYYCFEHLPGKRPA